MMRKILFLCVIFTSVTIYSQTTINTEDFESSTFGTWHPGFGSSATKCVLDIDSKLDDINSARIDEGGGSRSNTLYSDTYDLTSYYYIEITFNFKTEGFDGSDDFYLEYNNNGNGLSSSGWVKIQEFSIDTDGVQFIDGTKTTETVTFFILNSTTVFRFRSSSSSGDDSEDLFIDEILIEGFSLTAPTPTSEEIPEDANWRYSDGGSIPANDGEGDIWNEQNYDDSSWSFGFAELGYGDENTTVISSPQPQAVYFRKEFTIADHTLYNSLDLRAIRDDGLVVYLNGNEIWRDNMPAGVVTYATEASNADGTEDEWQSKTVVSTDLITGTNVIAVEVHNKALASSDLSFNFELTPSSTIINTELISDGDTWKYLDDGSDQDATNWKLSSFDDSSWGSGPTEIGYSNSNGDGAATDIGQPSEPRPITTYFRNTFTLNAALAVEPSILLEAVRDDAIAVYIDGTLVWKDGLDDGFNSSTEANQTIGNDDEEAWISEIITNTLSAGSHTIAVEIHQTSNSSSDISFNFKLTIGDFPLIVERGPYLQLGTPTSVIVKWRTNNPTNSIVNYGTSLGALSLSESDATLTTEHEVTLTGEGTGLTENTKYYYEIADGDGTNVLVPESSEMYVITSPPHGTKQFVRIWALGDPGTEGNDTYPGSQASVRDAYYNYVNNTNSPPVAASSNIGQTDMMLFLGDNAYNNGTDLQFQKGLFEVYDAVLPKTVAWSTRGNHEQNAGVYYDIFAHPTAAEAGGVASGTEEFYSFDYANIHFIVLESYQLENNITGPNNQLDWLEADIAATSQDWIIAFFHHPPYTKGSHDSDTEADLIDMRNNFVPALEAGGVDVVLNGHSHSYERSFFINGRLTNVNTDLLDSGATGAGKTVGTNGGGSGQGVGGEYSRDLLVSPNEGAVYIVTGSAGKATNADWTTPGGVYNTITGDHAAMYYSLLELGSTIIEIEDDGTGSKLNMKFLRENGNVDDYFTILKSSTEISTLATETYEVDNNLIKLYPVPANSFINVAINTDENLKQVEFYNMVGALIKTSKEQQINVRSLPTGMYMVQIITDKNRYYKSIIIE